MLEEYTVHTHLLTYLLTYGLVGYCGGVRGLCGLALVPAFRPSSSSASSVWRDHQHGLWRVSSACVGYHRTVGRILWWRRHAPNFTLHPHVALPPPLRPSIAVVPEITRVQRNKSSTEDGRSRRRATIGRRTNTAIVGSRRRRRFACRCARAQRWAVVKENHCRYGETARLQSYHLVADRRRRDKRLLGRSLAVFIITATAVGARWSLKRFITALLWLTSFTENYDAN